MSLLAKHPLKHCLYHHLVRVRRATSVVAKLPASPTSTSSRIFATSVVLVVLNFFAISLHAQTEPAPLYALPNAFNTPATNSATMTITARGRLIVTNAFSDTIAIIDPLNRRLDTEIPVGAEPHHVALTPDNTRILVANRGTQTLTIISTDGFQPIAEYPIGASPYGIVVSPDSASAYITRPGMGDVLRIDLTSGVHLETIPTPAYPVGLALWGEFLYVTHLWTGQVSLIYRPALQVIQTIQLHPQASHAHTITIDARNGLAYVPYTLSNTSAQFPDQALLPRIGIIDLARFRVLPRQTIDLITADRWLNLPYALTFDVVNNTIFLVSSASNALTILGRNDATARAHLPTDSAPRTVIVGRDGISVYVHNAIAQTVSLYETRFNTLTDTIPTSTVTDPASTLAQRAFYTTRTPLTPACASCHYDGMSDDRLWNNRPTPTLLNNANPIDFMRLTTHPLDAFQSQMGTLPTDTLEIAALVAYLRDLAISPPLIHD